MTFHDRGPSWFLAQLKPNCANIADENLKRQGFQTGLVAVWSRSECSFRPPGVRRPRGFFLPMLNADDVGYRSR